MIEPVAALQLLAPLAAPSIASSQQPGITFSQMLRQGVTATDAKVVEADRLVKEFALDDSIPAHQVTFALEEARLSLEFMVQVRNRLVESYQQLTNMQV